MIKTFCVVVMATRYLLLQLVQLSQDISGISFRHLLAISVGHNWTYVLVCASQSSLSHRFLWRTVVKNALDAMTKAILQAVILQQLILSVSALALISNLHSGHANTHDMHYIS